ncbi:MAG: ATP-binding cassette domain-containing protein, partial [Rhizobiales bacterium]|nr:ATP-binding cassette domain-containing protein [Hyphomicrobiales bacterium]
MRAAGSRPAARLPLGEGSLDNASAAPLLDMRGISKSYGGVAALADVDFAARPASIHAVLGENGAGKSTLIKII